MNYNKAKIAVLTTFAALVMFMTSCYKKFDTDSYKPAFTINGFTSAGEIQSNSLVGYWSFDNGLTEAVSGMATTNAGTTSANGFKGSAISMSAANKSYVTATPSAAITGLKSFTVSYWVNPTFTDADNNGSIDGIIGFVNLARTDDFWGNLDWFVENGSNNSAATLKVHLVGAVGKDTWLTISNYPGLFNKWSSHTLTYDAATSTVTYYINGSVAGSSTTSWTGDINFPSPGPLVFGCVQFQTTPSNGTAGGAQGWASYLTGTMDEIRVYNKALTAGEVNALVVLQGKGK